MSPKGTDAFVRRAIRFLLSPAAQGANEIIERGGGNLSINVTSLSPPFLISPHPRSPSENERRKRRHEGLSDWRFRRRISASYIVSIWRPWGSVEVKSLVMRLCRPPATISPCLWNKRFQLCYVRSLQNSRGIFSNGVGKRNTYSWRYVNFTILVELVLRTIAFLKMNINFRENGILDWYNNMIF